MAPKATAGAFSSNRNKHKEERLHLIYIAEDNILPSEILEDWGEGFFQPIRIGARLTIYDGYLYQAKM